MNDEKRISLILEEIDNIEFDKQSLQGEIDQIMSKGEDNLTDEDLARISELESQIEEDNMVIDELYQQIEEIRYGYSQELNQEQAQGVVEKAVNGETQRGVTFDEALDRYTGGKLDKDTTSYVVDAKDPNRYIVCTAENDIFRDQEYVKTTYEVYNGSKQVYATHDGRFEDRPKDYWPKEKAAMREKGGFSDLVIKFYSLKELEAYRENYKEQNVSELEGLDVGKEGRDYDSIIKTLEGQLDECGAAYKDGAVVDRETGKALTLTEDMSETDRARVAEAAVIGKQINNYQELAKLETDIGLARVDVLTNDEGTPERVAAQTELDTIQAKYETALGVEASLIDERKSVNAVQAEHETREEMEHEAERSPQEKTQSAEREAALDARNSEKSDNRLDERVDEMGEKQHTMEEYMEIIANRRAEEAAKGNDGKSHQMEHGGKERASKPKDRGER